MVKREILKLAIIEQRALVAKNIIRFELESYDADKLTLPTSKPLKRNSSAESLGEIDSVTEGEGRVQGASWRSRTGGECGAMSGARVVLKEPRHESREFVPRVSGKAANVE